MTMARKIVNIIDTESPWLTQEMLKKYLGGVSDEFIRKHLLPDRYVEVKKVGNKRFFVKSQIDRFIMRHDMFGSTKNRITEMTL